MNIRQIIRKRLSYGFITFFLLLLFTFLLTKLIPGNPFSDEQALSKEMQSRYMELYQLDRSIPQQLFAYFTRLLHGDLGTSIAYPGRSVKSLIAEGFPYSALLGMEAFFLALTAGVFLGTISALWHRKQSSIFLLLLVALGISVPSFLLASFLQYLFALKLHWLPAARWGNFTHTILPALSLACLPAAFIARMTRSNLLEVLEQPFVNLARAKGLPEWRVVGKHCLLNALLPLFPYLGQLTANILTGSFVVEKIFAIPGLGQWLVHAVGLRDYPVIMGINLFYGALLLALMTLVDILTLLLNPVARHTATA